ncbi:MAG: hypothetical protein ACI4RT_09070 [Candidatus Spyradenecus sp.]
MKRLWMLMTAVALLGTGVAVAALTEADLAPTRIAAAIKAKPAAERQALAKQILEAIAAQPTDEATKTQQLITASRVLISSGNSIGMIAEVFNSIPMEYLQPVAETLGKVNFDQQANKMTDAQFDAFCSKVVSSASRYIEASGTDSPTVRISILAATFSRASSDPERTRPAMIAALPASMQAAAATYIAASEQNNREVLAAATGVDEVAETPADPNAGNVVPAAAAAGAAATDTAASGAAATEAVASNAAAAGAATADAAAGTGSTGSTTLAPQEVPVAPLPTSPAAAPTTETAQQNEPAPEVKVPLLARFSTDVLGLTIDTMNSAMYDWEDPVLLPPSIVDFVTQPEQMIGVGEFGLATMPRPTNTVMPPNPDFSEILDPSPVYPNQGI